jgi:hypothetical protein
MSGSITKSVDNPTINLASFLTVCKSFGIELHAPDDCPAPIHACAANKENFTSYWQTIPMQFPIVRAFRNNKLSSLGMSTRHIHYFQSFAAYDHSASIMCTNATQL